MLNQKQMQKLFQKIRVVRPPKHRLATFGTSHIQYNLITDVPGLPDRSRLRTGRVTAEKPSIITPQHLKELFQGFSSEASAYSDSLIKHYGEALRGLEYQFRNEPISSRIELSPPDQILKNMIQEHDRGDYFHQVLIQGTDQLWELSIMKFIVEETMASFATNLQELNERGFFEEGDDRLNKTRHREIRHLILQAQTNRSLVPVLGMKLKEYGLFEQYQDAFFKLVNR